MSAEDKAKALEQYARAKELLDGAGVEYDETHPCFLSFDNKNGQCMLFPSQTHDGKLVVFYQVKEWHDTAEDALASCGVLGEEG